VSTVSWKPRLARAKWVLGFGAQYQGPQNKKRNTQDDDDDDDDFCMQKTFACVVVVVRPRIIMDLIMFLQLRTGWYCCVTQNSVDETLMDENGITSFNRWKPEKAPKTLDEKSITSIHRLKPEKPQKLWMKKLSHQSTAGSRKSTKLWMKTSSHQSNPWKKPESDQLLAVDGDGRKGSCL